MLKIGDTLTLEPKYSLQPEKYQAKVVEMQGNHFFIDYPVNLSTRKTVFLIDGTQMKISFIGADQNVYLFDTEVLGRKKANIPMIQLYSPDQENFLKIQRRQFVRIETPVDTAVHSPRFHFKPFTAITLDISAGGVCLLLPRAAEIHPSSEIILWIVLPMKSGENQYLKIKSRVIRIDETDSGKRKASIQFLELADGYRQNLIRFCFEKQLEMKKKGLEI